MRSPRLMLWSFATVLLFAFTSAQAVPIYYETESLGGNTWRYDYTVANETLGFDIEEFTIFFALGSYENLTLSSAPSGWDPIEIQPDPLLPDDGFFDALALSGGLAPGGKLGGFSIVSDYLLAGTPGSQFFDIVDPISFETLFSGVTIALPVAPPTSVPEPGVLPLVAFGLLMFIVVPRRRAARWAAPPVYDAC